MIPKECKRLIEVDFPIAEVSRQSAREKSIRHGHPSTLHLWWARRPLASCRAVLLGLLMPDPCDPHCPEDFKRKARKAVTGLPVELGPDDNGLRKALLDFIGKFSNWDLSTNQTWLKTSHTLVKAAYPEETPLVVDPFAGGGSIPLEALRIGCDTFASDLNPVACLILKVLLEDIPRHGPELADELRRVGKKIKEQAEQELKELYPNDPDGSKPIAYLWARTVRCEAPGCGAEIPLMRSFRLSKKKGREKALHYQIDRSGSRPQVRFEIFEPKFVSDVPDGTVTRGNATCPACKTVLTVERVRIQISNQRGGADVIFDEAGNRIGGARMLAIVTIKDGRSGRHYQLPTEKDYRPVYKAVRKVRELPDGVIPNEPLPPIGTLGFRVQRYGMLQWGDLFTVRQKVFLRNIQLRIRRIQGPQSGDKALAETLAMVFGRTATYATACGWWHRPGEKMGPIFGRPALPIVWDFAEVNPLSDATGGYLGALRWVTRVLKTTAAGHLTAGQICQDDACLSSLPDTSGAVWFTDPPYYDAIPYSDLSDFFYVWFKRTLPGHSLLQNRPDDRSGLTTKKAEIVQDDSRSLGGASRIENSLKVEWRKPSEKAAASS